MNRASKYIKIIDTVEVNGCYLEEHRSHIERRKRLKKHFNIYERRAYKHRRHLFKIDTEV